MSKIWCHLCGKILPDGTVKYEVAVRVRSVFDGTIEDLGHASSTEDLVGLPNVTAQQGEEDLNRQVYEDDVFIMCATCKETFLQDIYSHIQPEAAPEHGRAHVLH